MVLVSYLHEALIPNEKFKVMKRWRSNGSFVHQFLRKEILRSQIYPFLRPYKEKIQLKFRNLVRKSFNLEKIH